MLSRNQCLYGKVRNYSKVTLIQAVYNIGYLSFLSSSRRDAIILAKFWAMQSPCSYYAEEDMNQVCEPFLYDQWLT